MAWCLYVPLVSGPFWKTFSLYLSSFLEGLLGAQFPNLTTHENNQRHFFKLEGLMLLPGESVVWDPLL